MVDSCGSAVVYAFSDVHGFSEPLRSALELIDLKSHPNRQLIALGDYIDRGPDSAEVLSTMKLLTEQYPLQVAVLLGNHERDWLDWLDGDDEDFDWLSADEGFVTTRSFLGTAVVAQIAAGVGGPPTDTDTFARLNRTVKDAVKAKHAGLIAWVRSLPLLYCTDEHIFVHAGVEEDSGKDWLLVTADHVLLNKYPATFGRFVKTVVAGHVTTATMHDDGHHGIYFDGASHYYIDGDVPKTGVLNILRYDGATGEYAYLTAPTKEGALRGTR